MVCFFSKYICPDGGGGEEEGVGEGEGELAA